MRRLLTSAVCLLLVLPALAQLTGSISTDRPGISNSSSIMPAGILQFEAGAEYFQDASTDACQLPTILFRTGLARQAELRAGMRVIKQDSLSSGDRYATYWSTSALSLGAKVQLMQQQGWKPEIALLVNLVIPYTNFGKSDYAYFGHDFLLIFTRELSPKLSFTGNIGGAWAGGQPGGVFNYTTCLSGKISLRTSYFVEHYAFWTEKEKLNPSIDAGLSHLLSPNIQLDFSAGTNLNNRIHNYFLSTGISFRIDTHRSRTSSKAASGRPSSRRSARGLLALAK